ncbi:hypothetical protein B4N89_04185 [Embleya scabrispora]|uniref:Glycosyltransferase RgtA/B/C/D-like domain-containing protein n=1 Tax=Embleya scabrispora TaxID=159449 RepID=A0A1T3NU83_9ACTN|nr:hypothetical protein [Embleya scabrispora]OPC80250.1 hypothetical protein B4N89_04185 [Embleya scabrispora]
MSSRPAWFTRWTGRPPRLPWGSLLALAAVGVYVSVFAWAMEYRPYDTWGALIVFPLLLTVSVPLLSRFSRDEPPWVRRLVIGALVAKLLACFARYWMSFVLYEGRADAATYDLVGRAIAPHFRDGDFTVDIGRKVIGTGFIMIVTGIVYAIVGQSLLAGYLVYSWLGFWGLYLFWRAFNVAYPDGDRRRYGKLLFFLPSLLFWPSGIGKDTWMMFTLGMAAYGVALLLVRKRGAFVFLILGAVGTTMVRPHVTVLLLCGLCVGYLLRNRPQQASALGPLRAAFGIVVLGVGCVLALQQVGTFFGTPGIGAAQANQVIAKTQTQTAQGGSAQAVDDQAALAISPAALPQSLVTVLFRPFPFEAHNIQALVASLEGVVLMGLFVVALPRLKRIPGLLIRRPYVAFVIVYTLVFALAFANIRNFGILTRERVQVFPFVLVLLAVSKPERTETVKGGGSERRRRRVPVRQTMPVAADSESVGTGSTDPGYPGEFRGDGTWR